MTMDQHTRLILESLFTLLRAAQLSTRHAGHGTSGDRVFADCGNRADDINRVLREHDAPRPNGALDEANRNREDIRRQLAAQGVHVSGAGDWHEGCAMNGRWRTVPGSGGLIDRCDGCGEERA